VTQLDGALPSIGQQDIHSKHYLPTEDQVLADPQAGDLDVREIKGLLIVKDVHDVVLETALMGLRPS